MSDATPEPIAILASLGFHNPARVAAVTGGADMAIWRVEQEGVTYALRVFRPGQDATFWREVAAMRAAISHDLPAPPIEATGDWSERKVLLLRWMPGQTLENDLYAHPWLAWHLGVAFGRMQGSLHQIPAPPDLLAPSPSWIDWAEPDEALRQRLSAVTGAATTLLHLDYHPRNVLVAQREVTAILDWTNARAGDPRADVARTASILRFGPLSGLPAPLAAGVRRALMAGWRHGYRSLAGPLLSMAPFYGWAGTLMVRDLSPRLGRPDLPWITPAFLARVQSWADRWLASC